MSFKVTPNVDGTVVLSNGSTGKDLATFDTQSDRDKLAALDAEAETLRTERAGLV